jgi:mRNA degradation ribonuclease J1/J2
MFQLSMIQKQRGIGMTRIGFFNGLKEIGGTFVAVETESARCMFDFGFAVADRLDAKIRLRNHHCTSDHVRLGVLAAADGIYEQEAADELGLLAYQKTKQECFFVISHMHIDHMGGLGMLHPDLPVYMSEDSKTLYERLAENGEAEVRKHKNCIGVAYGEPFTVGDITVTAIPVDHDVIGACGFLITTPDGSIAYTGDYRFHGFHPDRTEAFAQAVKGVDVLITEGVTVSFEDVDMLTLTEPETPPRTENDLQEEIAQLAREEEGLLVVNPYNRNVERLHHLIHTLAKENRTLVMDGIQADYVAAFYPEDEICVYQETAATDRIPGKTLPASFRIVTKEELLSNPGQYVLQQDYADLYELLDLKTVVSRYIHIDGAPLGSYDPSFQKLHSLLEYLGIPYDLRGLGGHSAPYYLKHMVDTVAPKTLIPLHSFRPEQVNSRHAKHRILPEFGDWFALKNGALTKEDV